MCNNISIEKKNSWLKLRTNVFKNHKEIVNVRPFKGMGSIQNQHANYVNELLIN